MYLLVIKNITIGFKIGYYLMITILTYHLVYLHIIISRIHIALIYKVDLVVTMKLRKFFNVILGYYRFIVLMICLKKIIALFKTILPFTILICLEIISIILILSSIKLSIKLSWRQINLKF